MLQRSNETGFSTQELAQEVLRWLKRDIPETVVATLRVILTRYIETEEWKDDIGMMIGKQPAPPLSIQRLAAAQRDSLAAQNRELREALEELVTRCDGEEGVRADGSNIQTMRASAVLAKHGR